MEPIKAWCDIIAGCTATTVFLGWMADAFVGSLPALAAAGTLFYTGLRIYDWFKGRK